jgi:hypothetical protein
MELINCLMLVPAVIMVLRGLWYFFDGPQNVHALYVTRGTAAGAPLAEEQTLWEWVIALCPDVPHAKWRTFVRAFGVLLGLMGLGLGCMAWRFNPSLVWLPLDYVLGLTWTSVTLFMITLHFRGPAYLVAGCYTVPLAALILHNQHVSVEQLVVSSCGLGVAAALVCWLLLRKRLSWDR